MRGRFLVALQRPNINPIGWDNEMRRMYMEEAQYYLDRTLEENVPELLDYLRPDISVLDVG